MKKFFVMIMACIVLTSCGSTPAAQTTSGEKSETQTEQTEETRESETLPEGTETHDTDADEKDEALELWIREMGAVDNAISELMESENFNNLKITEKTEQMLALLNELAANGTEEYHYPLIKAETIYYDGDDMISFEYAGGGRGGVKLKPFDPMFN